MKTDQIQTAFAGEERRSFMRYLLRDLRALEQILRSGAIEEGVRRVGAEQELFLLDASWHPAPKVMQVLAALDDPHYTTELGAFNLEINLDPQNYGGKCLSRMEEQLEGLVSKLRRVTAELGFGVVLTGILPTIRKTDLGLENMTPNPRYRALNEALGAMRGGHYDFYIKGVDELVLRHDSVMLEACNASFQAHFQVGASEFVNLYNLSQAVAGPLLACTCNSPLLFGRRLWRETRIALFQQAVDTRSPGSHPRDTPSRVSFGERWIKNSVMEIYREDVARFRTLVGIAVDEDPLERLSRGETPELKALRLHNGTVYRWMRACYGITDGKPHLRIENRIMPSGPTIVDEIANAAFWFGMLGALASQYDDITRVMEFEHAKMNFLAAARAGMDCQFTWIGGEQITAKKLLLERLLPMASDALDKRGIDPADRERYMGVIEKRLQSGQTGAQWMLTSLAGMKQQGTAGERHNALTAATVARQTAGIPVHEWPLATLAEAGGWKQNYFKVEQFMETDLFTVHADDPVDLAANLMEWERIRYVPVEDHQHRLVGLVSARSLLRLLAHGELGKEGPTVPVSQVMKSDLVTVGPETSTVEAIRLMRTKGIGCLPVVHDGRLVGIVTERDFMDITSQLLDQKLQE